MPAHGVGFYGTLVDRRPRTVQKGGRIRYNHKWFQSDLLIPYEGQRVMFDWGLGHLDDHYPVTECWTERIGDARWLIAQGKKRHYQTVEGKFICYALKVEEGTDR